MKKIIYIFLARPVTTLMFYFSVIVCGVVALFNLPVELSPHVEYPRLTVSISWAGVSPEAVEAFLTSPIEAELATIMGVEKISSTSSEGFSNITINFHPDTDLDFARIEINEKLTALKNELPADISPPKITPYIPDNFQQLQGFLTYSVSSSRSANEVRKFLIENLLLQLKSVDGVSDVEIKGGSDHLIEIIVDYNKVKALGITNEEINNAVGKAEVFLSAGKLRDEKREISINVKNEIENLKTIEEQVVKRLPNGQSIRIKDIASVSNDFKEPQTYYRINNKETVTLIISKEQGANTFKVAEAVENRINELAVLFPPDYILIKEIDKSEEMSKDMNSLYKDGSYSLLILFVVLLFIYKNFKYPVIIIASIFFSLFLSFVLFYLFSLPLNIITIACFVIGFGFIVDNSIVVLDYMDRHYTGRGTKHLTILVKEIFYPLASSTTIIIAVFIPLIFLTGELKLYFEQFAVGMGFTLFASLIVAITVVPLLYNKTYRHTKKVFFFNVLSQLIYNTYGRIVKSIIRWRKVSIALLVLIIGLPVWLLPNRIDAPIISEVYNSVFDSEFYYEIKPYVHYALGGGLNLYFNHISRGELWKYGEETYIYVRLELPNGNRIDRINKLCNDLEMEIMLYKNNFKNLIANVVDEETAILRVEFTDKQAQTAFPYILKNYLTAYASRLGGVNSYVYGFGPGFSNAGGGASSYYNVVVTGFNYEKVKLLAEEFKSKIIRNPRIDNVDIDKTRFYWTPEVYEIIGKIYREKLLAYNISINELFSIIAKNTGGNFLYNKFRINNEMIEYRIKFSNYNNVQLEELKNIIISPAGGSTVKVKDLIDFEERKVLASINREDQQYIRYISFEFKGPYKYGLQFLKSSLHSMNVPEGYSIKQREFLFLLGEKDELDLLLVFLAAIVIIFMISASFFESLKKPFIILTAIPYSLAGVIFLFWLGDFNIERGAYSGMLLLVGLSVSSSIVMVNHLSKRRSSDDIEELIKLSKDRMRAIVTTTSTTVFALLPFILNSDAAFWKNLSLSIAGGIITSSIFVLLFVPMIYYLIKHK